MRKEIFVRKLFATNLIMVMLLSPLSTVAFAAFADSERSLVKDEVPLDKNLICGNDGTVFYSQRYKFRLKDGFENNPRLNSAHVVVKVKDHEMQRCWKTLNPKKFGRKIVKVHPEVNRFSIEGPARKAAWWDIKNRIKYWWKPENLYVNYALVLTSKEDEDALEAQEIKVGSKKREIVAEEELIKNIEENNRNDQAVQLNTFKREYLRKVNNGLEAADADKYDPYDIATQGKIDSLEKLLPIDKDLYYNGQEVQEINRKIMENKQNVIRKLSDAAEQKLITSGKIVELSRNNPEQTYRLIINNNIGTKGNKEAFKFAYVNSKLERPLSLLDGGKLMFESDRVYDLPSKVQEAFNEGKKDNELAEVVKDVKTIENKPTFLTSLYNCLPEFCRDTIVRWIQDTKEDIKKARQEKNDSRAFFEGYTKILDDEQASAMSRLGTMEDDVNIEYEKAKIESEFRLMKSFIKKLYHKYRDDNDALTMSVRRFREGVENSSALCGGNPFECGMIRDFLRERRKLEDQLKPESVEREKKRRDAMRIREICMQGREDELKTTMHNLGKQGSYIDERAAKVRAKSNFELIKSFYDKLYNRYSDDAEALSRSIASFNEGVEKGDATLGLTSFDRKMIEDFLREEDKLDAKLQREKEAFVEKSELRRRVF